MSYQPGDRVRWDTTADDGLPLVRYGFVGSAGAGDGRVTVMFDGDLKSTVMVPIDDIALVSITTVELRLTGCDLLDDPAMRQGLVHLWSAEADQAGLDVGAVTFVTSDSITSTTNGHADSVPLAQVHSGGQQYLLHARPHPPIDTIFVRADHL